MDIGTEDKKINIEETLLKRVQEGGCILFIALGIFLFIALLSYSSKDSAWSQFDDKHLVINNMAGLAGAYCADIALHIFGYIAYMLPGLVIYIGIKLFYGQFSDIYNERYLLIIKILGYLGMLLSSCALVGLFFNELSEVIPHSAGGILGEIIVEPLQRLFNSFGASLILIACLSVTITLSTGFSWQQILHKIYKGLQQIFFVKSAATNSSKESAVLTNIINSPVDNENIEPTLTAEPINNNPEQDKQKSWPDYSILNTLEESVLDVDLEEELQNTGRLIEKSLNEFGVQVKIENIQPGPVVTQFEISLAPGTKSSKISSLSKDLARSIAVSNVRVVDIIPGKSAIAIEVPNPKRSIVSLREIIQSPQFMNSDSKLTLALGKSIAGQPIIADLTQMPHLLIAGATGSGKSVGLNTMLISLLYKCSPAELRLLLIDPKMLELAAYDGLPHLLSPVITDMEESNKALLWCVNEMERRYKLIGTLGVRNIHDFNEKIIRAMAMDNPIPDPLAPIQDAQPVAALEPLPYIVILIDELADMMISTGKKVEDAITRITQKARAAGMHMIVATQRPSVDVLTGLIKANIPTRISFQVSSKIDSRTILDQIGAEALLGQGDMLYLPPGTDIATRVHGAWISDEEIHKVVAGIKNQYKSLDNIEKLPTEQLIAVDNEIEVDSLYEDAVKLITQTRKVSISHVQRHLRVGYNRAARIVEYMEEQGIVSKMQANGLRDILVD